MNRSCTPRWGTSTGASITPSSGPWTPRTIGDPIYSNQSGSGSPATWYIGDPNLPKDQVITLTIPLGGGPYQLYFGPQTNQTPIFSWSPAFGVAAFAADLTAIVDAIDPGAVVTVVETSPGGLTPVVLTITFSGTLAFSPVPLFGELPAGANLGQVITVPGGGADTETLSEFPNAFTQPTVPAPRNGVIKFTTFVNVNPAIVPLFPTLNQVTIYAAVTVPEDFGDYPTTAGQLLEIDESIPNPLPTGGTVPCQLASRGRRRR